VFRCSLNDFALVAHRFGTLLIDLICFLSMRVVVTQDAKLQKIEAKTKEKKAKQAHRREIKVRALPINKWICQLVITNSYVVCGCLNL